MGSGRQPDRHCLQGQQAEELLVLFTEESQCVQDSPGHLHRATLSQNNNEIPVLSRESTVCVGKGTYCQVWGPEFCPPKPTWKPTRTVSSNLHVFTATGARVGAYSTTQ